MSPKQSVINQFKEFLLTEAMVDVLLDCDGQSLKAHKIVLSAYSPFFRSLFLKNPCEHPIVILKDMKYTELKIIIDFMYCGEVTIAEDQLSAVLKTAQILRVRGLGEMDFEKIQRNGETESPSVDGSENPTVTVSKDQSGDKFCFKWNDYSNVMKELENFLSNETMVDVTLGCDGQSLKAHKIVLSAYSSFFRSLFLENPCKHPIVILKDMKYTELKSVIDFMYCGKLNLAKDPLSAVIKTAQALKVKGLLTEEPQNSQSSNESENHTISDESKNQSGDEMSHEPICMINVSSWSLMQKQSLGDQTVDGGFATEIKQENVPDEMDINISHTETSTVSLQSHDANSFIKSEQVEQNFDESFALEESFEGSANILQNILTDILPGQPFQSSVQSSMELHEDSTSNSISDTSMAIDQESSTSSATVFKSLGKKKKLSNIPEKSVQILCNSPEFGITSNMAEKLLFKIWNAAGEKKAIVVQSFEELLEKGAQKLNIQGNVKVYMQDGTEIEDDDVLSGVEKNSVLFLLSEGDPKPWLNATGNKFEDPVFSPQNKTGSPSVLKKAIKLLPWPAAFIIPKENFSTDLINHIEKGELQWSTKSELLGHISNEIRKYTFTPTAKQRDIVSRALISEFPSLKSNIGEGHEGWSAKIYDKVREDVRKNKELVQAPKRKVCTDKLLLTPKRQRRLSLEYIPSKVNTEASQCYLSMMESEMKKIPSARDKTILAIALEATFIERRALVNTDIRLSDLFLKYPALFTVEGINLDFRLMKNCNLTQMVLQGLDACSSAIIEFAEKKRKKNQIIENLVTHFKIIQNDNVTKINLATALLPNILGESSDFLYKEYDVGSSIEQLLTEPVTPHVAVIGNIFNATEVYVVAEKNIVVECNSFLEAVSAAVGMYFVCNIEYPKQAATTYLFFESYILKLMPKTIPTKLITFCNALPKI